MAWRGHQTGQFARPGARSCSSELVSESSQTPRQTWQVPGSGSFVSAGCGFGSVLGLRLGAQGVEAGSGTECVSINPQPEFHLDKLWESIPEAWAGPQYLCKAVLPGCVHGLCSWRGRKLLRVLQVVFSM